MTKKSHFDVKRGTSNTILSVKQAEPEKHVVYLRSEINMFRLYDLFMVLPIKKMFFLMVTTVNSCSMQHIARKKFTMTSTTKRAILKIKNYGIPILLHN